jgi:uncharacterized membrane protein YheB (UPF0754 family)
LSHLTDFSRHFADKLGEVTHSDAVLARIEALIDNRLQELTPQQIKLIVQQMMRNHLGWLVVWGGVVGGVLGFYGGFVYGPYLMP